MTNLRRSYGWNDMVPRRRKVRQSHEESSRCMSIFDQQSQYLWKRDESIVTAFLLAAIDFFHGGDRAGSEPGAGGMWGGVRYTDSSSVKEGEPRECWAVEVDRAQRKSTRHFIV